MLVAVHLRIVSELVLSNKYFSRDLHCTNRVDNGQELVAENDHEERDEQNQIEHKQQLPGAQFDVWLVDRDAGGDQRGEAEIDRERDCPISNDPNPAGHERQ